MVILLVAKYECCKKLIIQLVFKFFFFLRARGGKREREREIICDDYE